MAKKNIHLLYKRHVKSIPLSDSVHVKVTHTLCVVGRILVEISPMTN